MTAPDYVLVQGQFKDSKSLTSYWSRASKDLSTDQINMIFFKTRVHQFPGRVPAPPHPLPHPKPARGSPVCRQS